MTKIERLDFTGLTYYDSKIKAWVEERIKKLDPYLSELFNDAEYDSEGKQLHFKHDDNILASVDVSDFVIDGMVQDVEITKGTAVDEDVLKITFNTDANSSPIEVPLKRIFNPANYYNKEEIDNKLKNIVTGGDIDGFVKEEDLIAIELEKIEKLFSEEEL